MMMVKKLYRKLFTINYLHKKKLIKTLIAIPPPPLLSLALCLSLK